MSQNSKLEDDEIDLRELFAALWSHNLLIIVFTGISIFFAGYYSLNVEKQFTARSVFQIEENRNRAGFSLTGELSALASIAGFSSAGGSSNTGVLFERATSREFILDMKDSLSLEHDPYFNSYDPDYKDPFWKAAIKQLIGWQKTEAEKNALIEANIIKNYKESVLFDPTKNDVTRLKFHVDPKAVPCMPIR